MKKFLILVLAPATAVLAVVGLLLLSDGGGIAPSSQVNCKITVDPTLNQKLGGPFPDTIWQVYSHEGAEGGINAFGEQTDEIPSEGWPKACRINVRDLPTVMKGVDWRMGLVTPLNVGHKVETVTFKAKIKANEPTSLPTGTLYLHDGISVAGIALSKIGPEWNEVATTITTQKSSSSLEAWFRLGLEEGQITPDDAEILVSFKLENGDTRSSVQKIVVSNNMSIERTHCKLDLDEALRREIGAETDNTEWIRYLYPNEDLAPKVDFVVGTGEGDCGLKVVSAPQTAQSGLDWRIGKKFSVTPALQGKKLIFSVKIKATAPVAFDTSRAYTYNGVVVKESAIDKVGPEWKVYETEISLDQNVSSGEVWYRLLLDNGTVVPAGETIYIQPSLRLAS